MLPKWHFVLGVVLSIILILFLKFGLILVLIFFVSSIVIDVDHYMYYIWIKKDWNLKKAYKHIRILDKKKYALPREKRNKIYQGLYLFHGIETLIILLLMTRFISGYFIYMFFGAFFHLIIDVVDQRRIQDRWDRVSIIYDYFKFKKLKKMF